MITSPVNHPKKTKTSEFNPKKDYFFKKGKNECKKGFQDLKSTEREKGEGRREKFV